jgi:hypothetical protein
MVEDDLQANGVGDDGGFSSEKEHSGVSTAPGMGKPQKKPIRGNYSMRPAGRNNPDCALGIHPGLRLRAKYNCTVQKTRQTAFLGLLSCSLYLL